MRLIKIFSIVSFFIAVLLYINCAYPSSVLCSDFEIADYNYLTHFSPNETVSFSASIKHNSGLVPAGGVLAAFILTKYGTTSETQVDTGAVSPALGQTLNCTNGIWTAQAGLYTVTIILFDAATETTRYQTIYAPLPISVGTTTDSVAAFPRVLDLGALQYGRYMHPVPIEISWDFFEYSSQIRNAQPWYMRIYTDNHKRYKGVDGAIYSGRVATQSGSGADAMGSPAGLISSDGKYAIPLKIWCLNYGPDVEEGWDPTLMGPPPVKEDYYWKGPLLDNQKRDASRVAWEWIPDYLDMTADNNTWRKLIGQDPYDTHYVSDANPTGDFTLASPFQIFLAYETSPTAVEGQYWTDLIIEIYSP